MSTQAPPPATARLPRPGLGHSGVLDPGSRAHGGLASTVLESPFVRLLPLLAVLVIVSLLTDPGRPNGDEVPILAAAHRLLHGYYAVQGNSLWVTDAGGPNLVQVDVGLGREVNRFHLGPGVWRSGR